MSHSVSQRSTCSPTPLRNVAERALVLRRTRIPNPHQQTNNLDDFGPSLAHSKPRGGRYLFGRMGFRRTCSVRRSVGPSCGGAGGRAPSGKRAGGRAIRRAVGQAVGHSVGRANGLAGDRAVRRSVGRTDGQRWPISAQRGPQISGTILVQPSGDSRPIPAGSNPHLAEVGRIGPHFHRSRRRS